MVHMPHVWANGNDIFVEDAVTKNYILFTSVNSAAQASIIVDMLLAARNIAKQFKE